MKIMIKNKLKKETENSFIKKKCIYATWDILMPEARVVSFWEIWIKMVNLRW